MSNEETVMQLLDNLDTETSCVSEDELVRMGEDAVDTILKSATEINLRLLRAKGHIPVSDLKALERRIRLLGRIGSPRGIPMIAAALADSADEIAGLESRWQQREVRRYRDDPKFIDQINSLRSSAMSLNTTAHSAIVKIGTQAEKCLGAIVNRVSPVARQYLMRAIHEMRH